MTPQLHDNWEEAFDEFKADFQALSESYFKVRRRNKNQSLLPPKIRVIVHEMRQWIKDHNCSLYRVSEQAFETIHSNYAEFELLFSVAKTGFLSDLKENKADSSSSSSSSSSSRQPSLGTRSGAQRKRKRELDSQNTASLKRSHLLKCLLSTVGVSISESSKSPSPSSSTSSSSKKYPSLYENSERSKETPSNVSLCESKILCRKLPTFKILC